MTSASTKRRHRRNAETVIPSGLSSDAEIQRLRAAMVHAMDDCGIIANSPRAPEDIRRLAVAIAMNLRVTLEKK